MGRTRYSTEPEDPIGFTRKNDRTYSAFAGLYEAAVRRLPVWKTWLSRALPHVEGPRVLEVSCGTGWLVSQYADRVEVHGLDINRRMLEVTRQGLARAERGAALVQASVEHLPYRDGAFDCLVNTMAFTGYPRADIALSEIKRVLRPGGKLVLIDVGFPSDGNAVGTKLATLWKVAGDLIRDMESLFDAHGFEYSDEEIGGAGSIHLYVATNHARHSAAR